MRDESEDDLEVRAELPVTEPAVRPGGRPPAESTPTPRSGDSLARGASLGRYLILERLGAGGMGVVYTAYDPELDRKVAVKLLRGGRDAAARARLLREAQAMARLQHPHVIAVHDVGTWGSEVFVAMEFVPGPTLAALLRDSPLPYRRVLDLFRQAGEGLAAAHAAGLVHRDFKPQNVLVGDDGRVRVLDFGLARAQTTADANADAPTLDLAGGSGGLLATPLTRAGSVMGTPAYIAPEQFEGAASDVRSDQYSFSVALYEALYGEHPFGGERLVEQQAAVRAGKVRPAPEGSRVPKWLRRVVVRGLDANPEGRYRSMAALLAALADDPAMRRRRRLRTGAAAAAVIAVSGAVWIWSRQQSQVCKGSAARLEGIWDAPRKAAMQSAFGASGATFAAATWTGVERLIDGYIGDWVAKRTEACEATRRREQSEELMDLRVSCLDRRLKEVGALGDLLARADAAVVEKATQAAGRLTPLTACDDAESLLARAPLPADPATRARIAELESRLARAKALGDAGKYGEGLEVAASVAADAVTTGYRPLIAEAQLQQGDLLDDTGDPAAAEGVFYQAVWNAEAGRHDDVAARASALLVYVLGYRLTRPEEADRWRQHAEAAIVRLGGDPDLESLLENRRGAVDFAQSRFAEALGHFQRSLEVKTKLEGSEHPQVAQLLGNIGISLRELGRFDEAVEHLQRAVALEETLLGGDHPTVARTLNNLGGAYLAQGDPQHALPVFERALDIRRRALGDQHPTVALTLGNMGIALKDLGRLSDAEAIYRQALAAREKAYGPDHPQVATTLTNLGDLYCEMGRFAEAVPLLERALAIDERAYGKDNRTLSYELTSLGRALTGRGQPGRAAPVLERALALRRAQPGPAGELGSTAFQLARALWSSGGDRQRAVRLAEEARDALRAHGAAGAEMLAECESWLSARR